MDALPARDVWFVDTGCVALKFGRGLRFAERGIGPGRWEHRSRIGCEAVEIGVALALEQGFDENVLVVLGNKRGRCGESKAQCKADKAVGHCHAPAQGQPGDHVTSPRRYPIPWTVWIKGRSKGLSNATRSA